MNIKHYPDFKSEYVTARNIDVLLPTDYDNNLSYPVIYMHDGQNLFDSSLSFIGVDWGVSEALEKLYNENKIIKPIVVGIWNISNRTSEYMPYKAYQMLSEQKRHTLEKTYKENFNSSISPVVSNNYLKFIVNELKPFIDKTFSTLKDRDNTFIMGSSMGGLISIYALTEYPDIFGGAGCLSTHWPIGNGIVIDYLNENMPEAGRHKIYFDFGTETTDKDYEPYQKEMDKIMSSKGYTKDKDWMTEKFQGAEHSERAWRKRVDIPLQFFLGIKK